VSSTADVPEIDYERAFLMYVERFADKFGPREPGAFVKFGKHMVTRLDEGAFKTRLDDYVRLHKACKKMIESGSTISDALVLDFVEAAAWVAVEAPNIHSMFRGEMGDPRDAAPSRGQADANATTQRLRPPGR
jgi:hypothetical protein